jgi:hypothetical protein
MPFSLKGSRLGSLRMKGDYFVWDSPHYRPASVSKLWMQDNVIIEANDMLAFKSAASRYFPKPPSPDIRMLSSPAPEDNCLTAFAAKSVDNALESWPPFREPLGRCRDKKSHTSYSVRSQS